MTVNKSFVISDESINSQGFRMITSGMKSDRFLKNPVMLDGHVRDNSRVLGRWENLRIEGNLILADAVWDDNDPYVKNIHRKVEEGFIKGCSLNAEPLKTTYNEKDDLIEVIEWELKEASIACVPSNANSLVLCDKTGTVLNKEQLIALSDNSTNDLDNLKTMKNIKQFARVLSLSDTATEDDVLLKTQEIAEQNVELSDENTKLTKSVEKLKAENKTLKDASKDITKNLAIVLVDGAVAANKVLPAERDVYLELAESNYETTKKLLDAKKSFKGITKALNEGGNADADLAFSDETKGWKWDDFFKKGRTVELKDKDADRYEELYKAKFKK